MGGGAKQKKDAHPVNVVGGYVTPLTEVDTAVEAEYLRCNWNNLALDPAETLTRNARELDYYFNSYSNLGIHEEMLKDRVRTSSYFNAMMNNRHLFKDKVVLDVGSGTGVLSMFAAKAGAKHVYAIEYSNVATLSRDIIRRNGLEDRITVLQERAEDVILPVESVDIIISEWMGYFLLYESMLDCVLLCRDRWLRKDGKGLILPDQFSMHIAAIEDGEYREERFSFWDHVYGLDYSDVRPRLLQEPLIDVVNSEAVVTSSACIAVFDLYTVKLEDLEFAANFRLTCEKQDLVHAYVAWFDCSFTRGLHKATHFSTAPFAQATHWKQTVFYMTEYMPVKIGGVIEGTIAVKKGSPNPRNIAVRITTRCADPAVHFDQLFYIC